MDTYEQYEKDCKKIRKHNKKLLSSFNQWMLDQNLSNRTADKHCTNIDFYINEFLLYEEAVHASDGAHKVDMFLGYWFIKKAMWASKTTIRENATSLKKFYQFLFEKEEISKHSLESLKKTIKEDMSDWLETLKKYDNPDLGPEDVWF